MGGSTSSNGRHDEGNGLGTVVLIPSLLLFISFVVVSAPFARIDSEGELVFCLAMDALAGMAIVSVAFLMVPSRPFVILAIMLGMGIAGSLSYAHWSQVSARKGAKDYLRSLDVNRVDRDDDGMSND